MLNRRKFLGSVGAGVLATSLPGNHAALAQGTPARIAWVSPTPAADGSPFLDELRRGLR